MGHSPELYLFKLIITDVCVNASFVKQNNSCHIESLECHVTLLPATVANWGPVCCGYVGQFSNTGIFLNVRFQIVVNCENFDAEPLYHYIVMIVYEEMMDAWCFHLTA